MDKFFVDPERGLRPVVEGPSMWSKCSQGRCRATRHPRSRMNQGAPRSELDSQTTDPASDF